LSHRSLFLPSSTTPNHIGEKSSALPAVLLW
jgi:hypothetical protein